LKLIERAGTAFNSPVGENLSIFNSVTSCFTSSSNFFGSIVSGGLSVSGGGNGNSVLLPVFGAFIDFSIFFIDLFLRIRK
jgi:ACR3 family arsenite efflux pump ArsB